MVGVGAVASVGKWPDDVELALYGADGMFVFQAIEPGRFDVVAQAARLAFDALPAEFHLGLKNKAEYAERWTESKMEVCEACIAEVFSESGYVVVLKRVKAPSVASVDEMIWRVHLRGCE